MRPSESYDDLMKVVKNWDKDSFYFGSKSDKKFFIGYF